MAGQDAQDISQMNAGTGEVPIASGAPRKSYLLWIVLSCVVVGVGLGVFVYQQSLTPATPSPTPRATPRASVAASPLASPQAPTTNAVVPVANKVTFPTAGKLRIFTDLDGIQLVVQIILPSGTKTITLPNRSVTATNRMNYTDSTFEVAAGDVATVNVFFNNVNDLKLKGWIDAVGGTKCGANAGQVVDMTAHINYATSLLSGTAPFAKQCYEDDDDPGEFNDVFLVWGYAPSSTTASPSPSSSVTASPSPSASAKASVSPSPSPSPSKAASPSPSASVVAATVATPTPSPRAAMPDTSDGVPVTGVFEITVGTVSLGLLFLVLGLFGLLVL